MLFSKRVMAQIRSPVRIGLFVAEVPDLAGNPIAVRSVRRQLTGQTCRDT
jgi:hypothetical protein